MTEQTRVPGTAGDDDTEGHSRFKSDDRRDDGDDVDDVAGHIRSRSDDRRDDDGAGHARQR